MVKGRKKTRHLMLLVLFLILTEIAVSVCTTKSVFGVAYRYYNFVNTIKWSSWMDSPDNFYAGEKARIRFFIESKKRYNSVLDMEYATDVKNVKVSAVLECWYPSTKPNYYDSELYNGSLSAEQLVEVNSEIDIPDIDAGSRCVLALTISPSDSGDNGLSWEGVDVNSRETIYKEFRVAKRPSFQVWGNGIYSNGALNVPISKKTSVDGEDLNGKVNIFGSFAELGVVSSGQVAGLSSGAGIGYKRAYGSQDINYDYSKYDDNFGGDLESNYDPCHINTLTFANVDCSGNEMGGYIQDDGGVLLNGVKKTESALISRFNDANSNEYTLIDRGEEDIRINNSSVVGNTTNFPSNSEKSTKFIKTKGTIVVDKDITYNSENITDLESIPKIILYANDIKINCNVGRVDAILVADNNINTCVDGNGNTPEDVNDPIRSKQLTINGAIIANSLNLNRTYGAGMGKASIIPAEIINYDSSLYLWDEKQETEIEETQKLVQMYSTELAPRY